LRSPDPARLPPEDSERLGRLTILRILSGIAVLSAIWAAFALGGFMQCARALDRLGPQPTCAQCQLAEPSTVIVRGTDTVATIVEVATLPPEQAGDDSLRLYRARLRRGRSLGADALITTNGSRGHLELHPPDSVSGAPIVGRLFIEGVDHPVPVHSP
jgi:hypothetical protein